MKNYEYAGFWIRLGAALIDSVIIIIMLRIPLKFIYGVEYSMSDKLIYGFWDALLGYIVPIVATIWFWLHLSGTPGKMILKLYVLDVKTLKQISFWQAVCRYVAYIPATLLLFLGLFWVAIDKKKQGWHDKLANTVVLRDKR